MANEITTRDEALNWLEVVKNDCPVNGSTSLSRFALENLLAALRPPELPLPELAEPDAPGVWYDREGERWASAAFRPFPVGDTYERRIALWRIYDDGCEAIPADKRKGRWVKAPAPPSPTETRGEASDLAAAAASMADPAPSITLEEFQERHGIIPPVDEAKMELARQSIRDGTGRTTKKIVAELKAASPPQEPGKERLPIGTRIRFLKTLHEDACGDHPEFLLATKGELGNIVKVGGSFHQYSVIADHWPQASFGIDDGEFEVVAAPTPEPVTEESQ